VSLLFKIGGVCVKIFPLSDPILLPLAPTIARTIADYLQSIAQKPNLNPLQKNWVRDIIEVQPDFDWYGQFQRSIRQIPTSQYQYVSTIAHQLAAKSTLTPLEICQNLDIPIPTLAALEKSVPIELDCWYNEASYIYFQLTPKSIELWLNYIHDSPLEQLGFSATSIPTESLAKPRIDLAIYAHARCCSLLKLAASEKVVRLATNWQISRSNCLVDVVDSKNRLTTESNYIFEHPAEQQLIQTLMAVLDVIYSDHRQLDSFQAESREDRSPTNRQISRGGFNGHQKSPNWSKLTIDLAQSWLEFDRHCQIFGDVKQKNPRLAIARCGLTAISRRYLQVLLENYLGVEAALEL
jgi:hypothetical protein